MLSTKDLLLKEVTVNRYKTRRPQLVDKLAFEDLLPNAYRSMKEAEAESKAHEGQEVWAYIYYKIIDVDDTIFFVHGTQLYNSNTDSTINITRLLVKINYKQPDEKIIAQDVYVMSDDLHQDFRDMRKESAVKIIKEVS